MVASLRAGSRFGRQCTYLGCCCWLRHPFRRQSIDQKATRKRRLTLDSSRPHACVGSEVRDFLRIGFQTSQTRIAVIQHRAHLETRRLLRVAG